MKIYICDPGAHHKNIEAIRNMMIYNSVEYVCCNDLSKIDETFNIALCFTIFFPPDRFPPHCKVIYGPQFFVFPHDRHPIHQYKYDPKRFFYNTLSEWNLAIHKRVAPSLTLSFVTIPLGLTLDAIPEVPPLNLRKKVMVYFKHRHPSTLHAVTQFLKEKGEDSIMIQYGSYKDADFKEALKDSRFVIWIGSHESQGFAFQETQASNVPILLWDVTSMRDEFNRSWCYGPPSGRSDDLAATSANCWSDDCGIRFTKAEELSDAYDKMNECLHTFRPRAYIYEKLSLTATYKHLLEVVGLHD